MAIAKKTTELGIVLSKIQRTTIVVPIRGITSVIPHKWTEKNLRIMRDKHMQTTTATRNREAKNPEEEANESSYWLPDGSPGLPAVTFKCAIVDAARLYDNLTMTALKRILFVKGEGVEQLVRITGDARMREDIARLSNGQPDLRYRNEFFPWSANLTIQFISKGLNVESVVNLVDAAGQSGVCDWRPSSPKSASGDHGMFEVDPEIEVKVIG